MIEKYLQLFPGLSAVLPTRIMAIAAVVAALLVGGGAVVPTQAGAGEADPFSLVDTCEIWIDIQANGVQNSEDLVRSLTCQFYINGFFDGFSTNDEYSYSREKPRAFQICFPDTVSIGDLINNFVRYVKTKNTSSDVSPSTVVYMSMVASYPCKNS